MGHGTHLQQDRLHQQNVAMLQLGLVEGLLPVQLLHHHLRVKLDLLTNLHMPKSSVT